MNNKLIIGAVAAMMSTTAWAVPARQGFRTVTQPDGTTIQVKVVGDEFTHYTLNEQGDILVRDANGYLCYGHVDANGVRTATTVRANIDADSYLAKSVKQNISQLNTTELNVKARQKRGIEPAGVMKAPATRASAYNGMGHTGSTFPPKGDVRGLVILVEYQDVKFNTAYDAGQYFSDMLNKDGFSQYNATGCAAEYFRLSSNNQFRPTFDVLGPITLPNNRDYYGGNDSNGDDFAPEDMVVDAVNILDDTVDFSKYDMDGDGEVDNIFIFYAGQGEASYGPDESVWPHSWSLAGAGKTFVVDGVKINHYACTNEWEKSRPDGVGTFIHEFSHVMGLPDLYTTDYNGSASKLTPDAWDVLDYGPYNNDGCTPPIYSAYERNAMGWTEPIVLQENVGLTISLSHIEKSNQVYLIPTQNKAEFFLLENRQQSGWDKYVPGHGLLVWHIDYTNPTVFRRNIVNNDATHQYVDIIEAGGYANNQNKTVMAQYPFPGTNNITNLTAETNPELSDWNGRAINCPLTDITETNGIITLNVSGGGALLDPPTANTATEIFNDCFTATWQPVAGADDYRLTVTAIPDGKSETHTADFQGNSSDKVCNLPQNWSSSTTDGYNTTGNYGQAAPSLKLAKNGAYLQSPEFDASVNSIKFWIKGNNSINSTLTVQGTTNTGSTVTLGTYTVDNYNKAGETISITNIPNGVVAVKFIYNKNLGNVAIDDVVIVVGSIPYIHPDHNDVSTGGQTSMQVKAISGISKYSYTVVAVNTSTGQRSTNSNPIEVTLSGQGVDDIIADSDDNTPAEYFNLQGMKVRATELTPGLYIERRGSNARKVIIK